MIGVIRDVILGKDIALGGDDPYASAALAGATVHTLLRRYARVPLHIRVFIGCSTVIALRVGFHYDHHFVLNYLTPKGAYPSDAKRLQKLQVLISYLFLFISIYFYISVRA